METKIIHVGNGRTAVTMKLDAVGNDYLVLLTAGSAHIGATALAIPCQLTPEGVQASVSVLTVPGHRDDIPASKLALQLCKILKHPVSLTVGMHVANATPEEITTLLQNADQATANLLSYFN